MVSTNNQGKELVKELHEMKSDRRLSTILDSTPALVLRGAWVFAEGASFLLLSIYGIYHAHQDNGTLWWRWLLTIAGVLVLLPAAHLLGKFFRSAGEIR
jgi:hypothetical protein